MTTKNLFSILTIAFLFSCSSTNREENSSTSASLDFKTFDTPIPFSGYWICEDYFNDIQKYRSPKKAQDNSEFIHIPERTLKPTVMIYNFHEGGPALTVLKKNNEFQLWELQDDSILTQSLNTIENISDTKIKIGDKYFIKLDLAEAQDHFKVLEEMLFKGIYTNASKEKIEFKNNGDLSGLGRFTYYLPINDYYDAGMQVEQVGLGTSEKDLEWLGFKFKADTLELYKLKCLEFDSTSQRCGVVEYGELEYKIWKK